MTIDGARDRSFFNRQKASTGISISVALPALSVWKSVVCCGSIRAMKKRAVISFAL